MNSHFHQSQTPTHHSSKPSKKRLAVDQLQILESNFNANQKLKAEHKLELASQLGVPPRQVAIWYQNKRARHKVETKEHEYKNIQHELGNVLAEKINLEKEVQMLKYELNKAREMLALASTTCATASDDDHANSYSPGNLTFSWLDTSNLLSGEEIYASLTGPASMLEKYTSNHGLLAESMKPLLHPT